jgi:hypothetical protein
MCVDNEDAKCTAFTVTCDAVGTTTGVSGEDRAFSFRVLADESSTHKSITRPGHIFPLVAKYVRITQSINLQHTRLATSSRSPRVRHDAALTSSTLQNSRTSPFSTHEHHPLAFINITL